MERQKITFIDKNNYLFSIVKNSKLQNFDKSLKKINILKYLILTKKKLLEDYNLVLNTDGDDI